MREPLPKVRACAGDAGRRPGGEAADTGAARVFRRSRNGLRPDACPLQGAGSIKPCTDEDEKNRCR